MSGEKRKIKLIDRDFQFRLIVKFIIINTFILVVFGALIYIFFNSEISANLSSAHVTYKNISEMLFPIVLTLSVINLLVTSVIIFVMVLYASHKIAGPMYRFNEAMGEISRRNLQPLTKIREKDQLKELSGSLTQMAGTLAADFTAMKEKIHNLKKDLPEECAGKLDELEIIINNYKL